MHAYRTGNGVRWKTRVSKQLPLIGMCVRPDSMSGRYL